MFVQGTSPEDPVGTPALLQPGGPTRTRITRISILQSSKILTALYFLLGLIYTLIGIPMILFGGAQFKVMGMIYLFMPVLMGVLGFVCIAIFGALYNLLAKWLGGIEFEVTTVSATRR